MSEQVINSNQGSKELSTRESSIALINDINKYFDKHDHLFSDLAKANDAVESHNALPPGKLILIVVDVVAGFMALFFLYAIFTANNISSSFLSLVCAIPFVAIVVVANMIHKKRVKKYDKEGEELLDKYLKISEEIDNLYKSYPGGCPLAKDYIAPRVRAEITTFINSGRADTLKEAINLLHDEMHKATLENEARAATQAARDAATNSSIAAAAGVVNLFKN